MDPSTPTGRHRLGILHHYFAISYGVLLFLGLGILDNGRDGVATALFCLAVLLSYSLAYLLPAIGLTAVSHRLLRGRADGREPAAWRHAGVYGIAVLGTALTSIIIYADRTLYALFGFHLNGFVWNLVTTPGGIESMGGGRATTFAYAIQGLGFVAFHAAALCALLLLARHRVTERSGRSLRVYRRALVALAVVMLVQSVAYGVSRFQNRVPIITATNGVLAYQPVTFRKFAKRLGLEVHREHDFVVRDDAGSLNYPLQPLRVVAPRRPFNLVWLVAESWGAKMLDPEIMPATTAFASRAHRFLQHYSGGNGTRMGMFTQFYGLVGSAWFRFLEENRSPVLMDVIQQQGYQLGLYTSAKFTYPEFDRTIFARVPRDSLHELDSGEGWERDRRNVSDMLDFLRQRDPTKPFMAFQFFESPHSRYYFPPESVIRPNYLPDFNYATMDLEQDIGRIHDRYVNSCHHLDSQFARVLSTLEDEALLDRTVVIITGDHGEEFLEKGHWGHNSEFTEEQIRVPLVLWIPGTGASVVDRMTSHLDLPATLAPLLGVQNPASDYSLGSDLLSGTARDHVVVADWGRLGWISADHKVILPTRYTLMKSGRVTTREDREVEDADAYLRDQREVMLQLLRDAGRFRKSAPGAAPEPESRSLAAG